MSFATGRYKTWLYAGTSEYPVVLAQQVERTKGSDNPSGADNQQETVGIEAPTGSSETARQARQQDGEDTVRTSWRHGEPHRNVVAHAKLATQKA